MLAAKDLAVDPELHVEVVLVVDLDRGEDVRADRAEVSIAVEIRAADTHLRTGFLSTPYLLSVLADHGHADVAYELLLRDTPPSWPTMIDRGATPSGSRGRRSTPTAGRMTP
ncbi:MAG TPA: hypothetical protein VFE59_18120 [Trebonia sp.]|nr:hypothetical protein [Trebonia sp.]